MVSHRGTIGSSEPKQADWFREALKYKGIKPCIPGRKSRRIATRYDRCPKVLLSAVVLAATVLS